MTTVNLTTDVISLETLVNPVPVVTVNSFTTSTVNLTPDPMTLEIIEDFGQSLVINLGGAPSVTTPANGVTRSLFPPLAPKLGDIWEELDSAGWLVERWQWAADRWISEATYQLSTNTSALISDDDALEFQGTWRRNGIYVRAFAIAGQVETALSPGGVPDSGQTYYEFILRPRAGSGLGIMGSTLTMQSRSYAAGANLQLQMPINRLYTISPNAASGFRTFQVQILKFGTLPLLLNRLTASVMYHVVR
jgi:hypothetical protein